MSNWILPADSWNNIINTTCPNELVLLQLFQKLLFKEDETLAKLELYFA